MPINKLTGTNERFPPPQLTDIQIAEVVMCAVRLGSGEHVSLFGREYWADPDGGVFVVAWEDSAACSGDPI